MKTRIVQLFLASLLLALPSAAFADGFGTVTATSGSFSANSAISGAGLSVAGTGFSLATSGPMSFGACGIGVSPDSSGVVSVSQCSDLFYVAGAAVLTMGATTQNVFIDESDIFANSATMSFLGGAPEVILSELVPFSGTLNVCASAPGGFGDPFGIFCPIPNELMGQVSLSGMATMTIDLVQNPDGSYTKNSVNYTFPVSTPEPATWAFLFLGLAALVATRKLFSRANDFVRSASPH